MSNWCFRCTWPSQPQQQGRYLGGLLLSDTRISRLHISITLFNHHSLQSSSIAHFSNTFKSIKIVFSGHDISELQRKWNDSTACALLVSLVGFICTLDSPADRCKIEIFRATLLFCLRGLWVEPNVCISASCHYSLGITIGGPTGLLRNNVNPTTLQTAKYYNSTEQWIFSQ